jgi:hypothetical protein
MIYSDHGPTPLDGYHDSFSLYEATFVPGKVDPFGHFSWDTLDIGSAWGSEGDWTDQSPVWTEDTSDCYLNGAEWAGQGVQVKLKYTGNYSVISSIGLTWTGIRYAAIRGYYDVTIYAWAYCEVYCPCPEGGDDYWNGDKLVSAGISIKNFPITINGVPPYPYLPFFKGKKKAASITALWVAYAGSILIDTAATAYLDAVEFRNHFKAFKDDPKGPENLCKYGQQGLMKYLKAYTTAKGIDLE